MFDYIARENLDVRSVLIVRNGYLVTEAYFYPHRQSTIRGILSCSKSFLSALVGIAIEEGYIESLDQKVLDFFPERTIANEDSRKQAMTLEHLLTMRCGLDWPESSVSYSSSGNILRQMFESGDWVQFVLDRPMVAEPGTTFNYSTGASHLLSAVLEKATGMRLEAFARTYLFEPLAISSAYWSSGPEGVGFGGGGLHIKSRDMAKFGVLYLESGVWDGRQQVVPADWVEASVAGPYYGYQWWRLGNGGYAALGYKGQRIVVLPNLEMVVVITGEFSGAASGYLADAFIIPAARSSEPLPENPEGLALLESRISEVGSSD